MEWIFRPTNGIRSGWEPMSQVVTIARGLAPWDTDER